MYDLAFTDFEAALNFCKATQNIEGTTTSVPISCFEKASGHTVEIEIKDTVPNSDALVHYFSGLRDGLSFNPDIECLRHCLREDVRFKDITKYCPDCSVVTSVGQLCPQCERIRQAEYDNKYGKPTDPPKKESGDMKVNERPNNEPILCAIELCTKTNGYGIAGRYCSEHVANPAAPAPQTERCHALITEDGTRCAIPAPPIPKTKPPVRTRCTDPEIGNPEEQCPNEVLEGWPYCADHYAKRLMAAGKTSKPVICVMDGCKNEVENPNTIPNSNCCDACAKKMRGVTAGLDAIDAKAKQHMHDEGEPTNPRDRFDEVQATACGTLRQLLAILESDPVYAPTWKTVERFAEVSQMLRNVYSRLCIEPLSDESTNNPNGPVEWKFTEDIVESIITISKGEIVINVKAIHELRQRAEEADTMIGDMRVASARDSNNLTGLCEKYNALLIERDKLKAQRGRSTRRIEELETQLEDTSMNAKEAKERHDI